MNDECIGHGLRGELIDSVVYCCKCGEPVTYEEITA